MYKNPVIKCLAGVAMLFIFAFSVTPKQWLHDLVTHHKDAPCISFDGTRSLSTSGFHCNCDNIVVESPFLFYDGSSETLAPDFFETHPVTSAGYFISTYKSNSSLRGPPCLV